MTYGEICPYDNKGRFLCRYKECTTQCSWRYNVDGRGGKEIIHDPCNDLTSQWSNTSLKVSFEDAAKTCMGRSTRPLNVGLYILEPFVNTAAMQVSQYHKARGDHVELYRGPLAHDEYDIIYAFSLFDFTPKHYVTKDMICGGTGFDIKSRLPPEIEACDYDWSLYPRCDFSMVKFSIGCPYKEGVHPFCVVPAKEGCIKSVKPKNLNPNGRYIKIMDNNFFANPEWRSAIEQLKVWGQPVDFQGVDVRTLNKEKCDALLSLKHEKQIHVAWDNPREYLVPKFEKALQYIKARMLSCYVLIGYWSTEEEDLYRVETLRDLGIDPFAMPYDKSDRYQMDFARWVNFKAIFKSVSWQDYKRSSESNKTLLEYEEAEA